MADVHESMIINTRVGAFRACTESMPAHIDGDSDWPQVNYYVRGGARRSLARGTLQGHEMQGCRLFIGQDKIGGQWLEVGTDPREPSMVTMVQFRAARQLHFVDTHRRAIRGVTDGFVRSIPFDNKDICQRICKRDEKVRGIRMAPLNPRRRGTMRCNSCGWTYGCPTYDANAWLEHLCACVQRAAGQWQFRCLKCMKEVVEHERRLR